MTGIQLLTQLLEQEQLNPGILHKTVFVFEFGQINPIQYLDFTINDRIDINI